MKTVLTIILVILEYSNSLMEKFPFFIGKWVLRATDDNNFKTDNTYLIINKNDSLKFKSTYFNGFVAVKDSRSGKITNYKSNNKNINIINIFTNKKNEFNLLKETNNIDITLKYKSKNSYSYSIFGIEIPEIKKPNQNPYNVEKNFNVKQNDKSIFVTDKDNNKYYLFDLNTLVNTRLPYVEIPINTLIITQIFGFIINLLIVKIINIDSQ